MMTRRAARHRAAAAVLATAVALGTVAAVPAAHAEPQRDRAARVWESMPAPVAPQVPGYRITGYNVGKGNYRGAVDPRTGNLWVTNVSPFQGATESSILELDPSTMRLRKRIRVTQRIKDTGHGTIAAQYAIGIPDTGGTVWTTAAAAGEANVWDQRTGKRLANITGIPHIHGVDFVEELGVAIVSGTAPGGLRFYDMNTYRYLGQAVMPRSDVRRDELGADIVVTDESAEGATVTLPSYYGSLTKFRISRPGGGDVVSKVVWNTAQPRGEGHGYIAVDTARNRAYVNHLYSGTIAVYDFRTGRLLREVFTGPGSTSMFVRDGSLYVGNYFGGYISVLDQRTLTVRRLLTTGILPNQLIPWKRGTFLVIDKSSLLLGGNYAGNTGVDRIWKVRSLR